MIDHSPTGVYRMNTYSGVRSVRLSFRIRIREALARAGRGCVPKRFFFMASDRRLGSLYFFADAGCVGRESGRPLIHSNRVSGTPGSHQRISHCREQRRITRIPPQRIVANVHAGMSAAALRGAVCDVG
jgi:hypothetical protein